MQFGPLLFDWFGSFGSLFTIGLFRGLFAITRFDRGYASETCPGLVSTLLFPNLRPSSNSPSTYPPIGRLRPSKDFRRRYLLSSMQSP